MIVNILRYFIFFPSITFGLIPFGTFPWTFFYSLFFGLNKKKIFATYLGILIISSFFTYFNFPDIGSFQIIRSLCALINGPLIFFTLLSIPVIELVQFDKVLIHNFFVDLTIFPRLSK